MAYLGLVPCEDSSGPRRRQGVITKAGNAPARRMLVEIAHQYRLAARVRPSIARRQSDLELPKAVTDIAWNAQTLSLFQGVGSVRRNANGGNHQIDLTRRQLAGR